MIENRKIISRSESDTEKFAKDFAKELQGGEIIALNGNLGSGKTFFVKSVCKALNIENATSPSFAIVNEYSGDLKIYHFDFYRINKVNELYDIGFEEYLMDPNAVVFIEWADMMKEVLPRRYYEININRNGDNREFVVAKS